MLTVSIKNSIFSITDENGHEIGTIVKNTDGSVDFKAGIAYPFNVTGAEFHQINQAIIDLE